MIIKKIWFLNLQKKVFYFCQEGSVFIEKTFNQYYNISYE